MAKHPFKTEAGLCAAFIADAEAFGHWTAYPETGGWDVLLSRKADGFQIGIQAKLQFNMKVLGQCVDDWHGWSESGPDVRAVLVPTAPDGAHAVCAALGLALIYPWGHGGRGYRFQPMLPVTGRERFISEWPEWSPTQRLTLPDYVPDVVAGASAPVQLTPWKIKALRLVSILELRGHLTRADFKAAGVDARRWIGPSGFLSGDGSGRFVRSPRMPDFAGQHPAVYAQIVTELASKGVA